MRYIILIAFLSLLSCSNKEINSNTAKSPIHIVSYNVENLFDTEDDPKTLDDEFTPNSAKQWTTKRYKTKLEHLSKCITASENGVPNIIGLIEIENKEVVEDLLKTGKLSGNNFKVVHEHSVDRRGIDNAFVYNDDVYDLIDSEFIQPKFDNGNQISTRKIVYAKLESAEGTIHFYVNHWPSRGGDYEVKRSERIQTATVLKRHTDNILKNDPEAYIIIMGDFNDYPNNKSISEVLNASEDNKGDFINLMWDFENSDQGTYNYKKDWGCLDQFMVTPNFLESNATFPIEYSDVEILKEDWMLYKSGDGNMYPNRTYSRDRYFGGYSDHLAISLYID